MPGFEKEPQDAMVYPGQIVYLSCSLQTSHYPVQIEWLKDEQPLQLDDNRMTILPSGKIFLAIDAYKSMNEKILKAYTE